MNKGTTRIIVQSASVALAIAFLRPSAWLAFLSEIRQSPVITTTERDAMSEEQHEQWFEQNAKPASFIYRIKTIPMFIQNHWVGILQATAAVFIVVFLLNYFALIFLHAKP
jgi:hypothetical protein